MKRVNGITRIRETLFELNPSIIVDDLHTDNFFAKAVIEHDFETFPPGRMLLQLPAKRLSIRTN